ncbi:hypothetical protein SAMN05446935_4261 [Burkholderia sp. YR290]|jgi:hypothetical protein|uniref:hypothetical protein n=1 Tax=Paraburkholderia hospita TaxID=169430 RepID=UPI0009A74E09|nr:hypothetical protein [Paraburkholderia hospita]SKD01831.1 hypothetical protein SAMN05446934_8656 [Paraburkholderia hospita]SOE83838.1 hypothetical protein SAMN05446935_4261 [Burkholderia sp. YR290]
MLCVVCAKEVPVSKDQNPWCSELCRGKWQRRQPFLFADLKPKNRDLRKEKAIPQPANTGENLLAAVLQNNTFDDDTLARLRGVTTGTRPLAIEKEVGSGFHKNATHYQQRTGKVETTPISADRMLEIAIMAYNTAILLHQAKKPVILYRIAGKRTLSEEEQKQTLSSSVRAKVDVGTAERKEVWPIEKTAAWIQGAMRARVSFVLLNDPREDLVGGVDKKSDAIYVREIFQIISTHYVIGKATDEITPKAQLTCAKGKILPFVLNPPDKTIGPLPLIPRMNQKIDWSHTWDGSKSSLTIGDPAELIRDQLTVTFKEAGTSLGIPEYPAKSWKVD